MATPFRIKRSAVPSKRPVVADLQLGELALNTYDGNLFAKRDTGGVGIGTTVSLLTPWIENYGGQSIFYNQSVGIGTTNATSKLTIVGDANISGVLTVSNGIQGIGIQSGGISVTAGILTALNFVGAGNSFSYNAGTKTIDIDIGGGQWTYTNTSNTATSNIYRLNGNVGIGTTSGNARLDIEGVLGVDTTVTGITTTAISTIDTLPISIYRSARFQVQITQSTDYQSTDLMVVHNGTTANIIEYGSVATNDYLASFSSTISSSNLLLQATMSSAGIATVKVVRYGVTI